MYASSMSVVRAARNTTPAISAAASEGSQDRSGDHHRPGTGPVGSCSTCELTGCVVVSATNSSFLIRLVTSAPSVRWAEDTHRIFPSCFLTVEGQGQTNHPEHAEDLQHPVAQHDLLRLARLAAVHVHRVPQQGHHERHDGHFGPYRPELFVQLECPLAVRRDHDGNRGGPDESEVAGRVL